MDTKPQAKIVAGLAELTLETNQVEQARRLDRLREHGVAVRGPVEHPGGDRSIYFEDPAGNLVEAWDFFDHGAGARDGVEALR